MAPPNRLCTRLVGAIIVATGVGIALSPARAADGDAIKRGELVFHAAGCESCHTDHENKVPLLAGGPAIKTPFGTFFAPNITPDRSQGIGSWSEAQFIRALRDGKDDDGDYLFPTMPYTSYTFMTDADLKDLYAYIRTVPPSDRASRDSEVSFPFSMRFLQIFWRWLYFTPGPYTAHANRSPEWNRGAYLATALVHCGECHTPRTLLGGMDKSRWLAGTPDGPNGHLAPNITPDKETGIGTWSVDGIVQYLATGQDPDGHDAAHEMAEVVQVSTSKLNDQDLRAIAVYLKSLKPIHNVVSEQHHRHE